jgi:hypothetical protein
MAFRAKMRHRWRSWLAIAVLVSIVAGLVLAATAAGHRTEAAFHPINPTSKPARLLQPTTLNAM